MTSLTAFNDRLWRMTGMPLRYFQEVAFWLLQHTAALEVREDGQRAGRLLDACSMAGPCLLMANLLSKLTKICAESL